ncbi:MAG: hypothetical protein IKY69_02985, partial [Bacteroidaceae bacterium]|nr:hypothetical protein [Bacteroidaceae bacterium]
MKRNNRLKLTGCILAALLAAGNVSAQKENGSIDTQMLKEFAESYKPTGAEKALRNVMLTTSVKTLATSQENKNKELNTYFSNTVNS